MPHGNHYSAIDVRNGDVLWTAQGAIEAMRLSKDGLLLVERDVKDEHIVGSFWLTSRDLATGAVKFRTPLTEKDHSLGCFREFSELIMIQFSHDFKEAPEAFLVDREGNLRWRIQDEICGALLKGKDGVFVTDHQVMRLTPDGKTVWTWPWSNREFFASGGIVDLSDGDLVAYRYCPIADSGVALVRLDPANGKGKWSARCAGLGVAHSKYYHHATAQIEDDNLKVRSKGSAGRFIEWIDLRTGQQVRREEKR
jgi:outer membrane protein assembly factor BamB